MSAKTDAVILALTTKWLALQSSTLTGVAVVDGPQVNEDASQDWLFVGYDGTPPAESTEIANIKQDLLAFARTKAEGGDVKCAAVSVRGDTDVPTARARAYAIVGAAEDALRADMTLGGLVMHAFVSADIYIPVQTAAGAKVRIVFTVTYQAQI